MTEGNVVEFKPRPKKANDLLTDTSVSSNMRSIADSYNEGALKGFVMVSFEKAPEASAVDMVRVRSAVDDLDVIQLLALQGALAQVQRYISDGLTGGDE